MRELNHSGGGEAAEAWWHTKELVEAVSGAAQAQPRPGPAQPCPTPATGFLCCGDVV
jgi:hypothetical protein